MISDEVEPRQQLLPPSSSAPSAEPFLSPSFRSLERLRAALDRLGEELQRRAPSRKAASALALGVLTALYLRWSKDEVHVYAQRNEMTEIIMVFLSLDAKSAFKSTWATHNGHFSTLQGYLRPQPPCLPCTRELIYADDGGHFALEWLNERVSDSLEASARSPENMLALAEDLRARPVVCILHGVNDSGQHSYMRHLAHVVCTRKGWRAVCMTYRGCGSLSLTSAQAYDAANTGDVALAVETICARFPAAPLFLVGFSLGANIMVKYLGEQGARVRQKVWGAVAISNPWAFHPHLESLHYTSKPRSLRRIPAWVFSFLVAYEYKKYVRRHRAQLADRLKALQRPLESMHTLRDLDENITVPLNGWKDLEHYMTSASSSEWLRHVEVPLLGVNALDDPLVSREALAHTIERASRNPNVILVTTTRGGHIGWGGQAKTASWAENLCVDFLQACARIQDTMGDSRGHVLNRGREGEEMKREGNKALLSRL